MPNSKSLRISFLSLIAMLLITSCYHKHERTTPDAITYTEEQLDSISFSSTHHYTNNYNFVVKADSLVLLKQQPEEKLNSLMTDSFVVKKHDALVVADIRILPTDSIDSVWVQVARDQSTFGWIHESTLLKKVVPDDPISQFISTFSDIHMLIFLIIIVVIGTVYIIRMIRRRNAKLVHFNDIDSFYPTALALLVASSATLYATIQVFAPDMCHRRCCAPSFAVQRGGALSVRTGSHLCRRLYRVQRFHLILYRVCLAGGLFLFRHQDLSFELAYRLFVRQLRRTAAQEREMPLLWGGKPVNPNKWGLQRTVNSINYATDIFTTISLSFARPFVAGRNDY